MVIFNMQEENIPQVQMSPDIISRGALATSQDPGIYPPACPIYFKTVIWSVKVGASLSPRVICPVMAAMVDTRAVI